MPPLLLLLLLLLFFPSPSVAGPTADHEISALVYIKSSLSPPLAAWDPLARPDHCHWPGVTCDRAFGRVTALNLTALIPSPLTGPFPLAVTNLTALRYLSLRGNNISGEIPRGVTNLRSLKAIDFSFNSLSGPIPDGLIGMAPLETLDLSSNQLSGEIRVGPDCRNLYFLALSSNFLVGAIPPEMGRCVNLKALLLNRNVLEGRIPAEVGEITALRVLDVSKNSLTGTIPTEIGRCRNLSVVVLTNLMGDAEEFNAFMGGIPPEILEIPRLEVLWAPRSNLGGRLVRYSDKWCGLRVLNLGLNYITGEIPQWLVNCRTLKFFDLSSNYLESLLPERLGIGCMNYFNVSRNSLSGSLHGLSWRNCLKNSILEENIVSSYYRDLVESERNRNVSGEVLGDGNVILHDFSWNNFSGSLPSLSLAADQKLSYGLLLNDNGFNESLTGEFFALCRSLGGGFAVNLSGNLLAGEIGRPLSNCLELRSFEAANNKLTGSIPSDIGNLHLLSRLDLRGNRLSGEIPTQLGEISSLRVLDLSHNSLMGKIPESLANAMNLEVVSLDHNLLSGEIPQSFAKLPQLTTFDVSFNNLSGEVPHFNHPTSCDFFRGNELLMPCPDSNATNATGSSGFPIYIEPPPKLADSNNNLKALTVAAVSSASVIFFVLVILVLVLISGKRRLVRLSSLKDKVVVIFQNTPAELSYESIVRATRNFSIQNLIGTGGFGATYKAELVPGGFLVAVKRLSVERFQGLQQFDAEIRTLGRIKHKNLVTLIGYHMGETDTFLIYNYLSGGNLEAFIRNMSRNNVGWAVLHKIAVDVAQALVFLHYSCIPRIVHRDIKPSNILLDDMLNAYLSDFGLARLLEVSETHATTDVAGTFGYVAPEYATTCRVSNKADVYSFGVVLLELVSGKRSLDSSFSKYGNGFTVVSWGRLLIQEGRAGDFFCPSLWEDGPKDNLVGMLRLALSCTVESLSVRPSMKQVLETLKQLKNF